MCVRGMQNFSLYYAGAWQQFLIIQNLSMKYICMPVSCIFMCLSEKDTFPVSCIHQCSVAGKPQPTGVMVSMLARDHVSCLLVFGLICFTFSFMDEIMGAELSGSLQASQVSLFSRWPWGAQMNQTNCFLHSSPDLFSLSTLEHLLVCQVMGSRCSTN